MARMSPLRARALALSLAAIAAIPSSARGGARCEGTLTGEIQAKFACTALLGTQQGGQLVFVVTVPGPVDGIPSLVPGAFQVPGAPRARTYTLADLGMGKASVAAEGGALYVASKTSGQRGEVTLRFTSLKKSKAIAGAYEVHGTYRARLVPAGGGKSGEVMVDVTF
jgi:hypothetical protein